MDKKAHGMPLDQKQERAQRRRNKQSSTPKAIDGEDNDSSLSKVLRHRYSWSIEACFGLKLLMSDLPAAILIDSVKALGRICEGIGIAL